MLKAQRFRKDEYQEEMGFPTFTIKKEENRHQHFPELISRNELSSGCIQHISNSCSSFWLNINPYFELLWYFVMSKQNPVGKFKINRAGF